MITVGNKYIKNSNDGGKYRERDQHVRYVALVQIRLVLCGRDLGRLFRYSVR